MNNPARWVRGRLFMAVIRRVRCPGYRASTSDPFLDFVLIQTGTIATAGPFPIDPAWDEDRMVEVIVEAIVATAGESIRPLIVVKD